MSTTLRSNMKLGVLGTGMVGNTIGSKLVQLGHDVKMGSRSAGNAKAVEWVKANGGHASHGTFAEAASFGEIIFNCTNGWEHCRPSAWPGHPTCAARS